MSRLSRLSEAVRSVVKISNEDPRLVASIRRRRIAGSAWIVGGILDASMTGIALYARTNFQESNPYAAYIFGHFGVLGAWIFDALAIAAMPIVLWKLPSRYSSIIFTDAVTIGGIFRMILASITIILLVGTNR